MLKDLSIVLFAFYAAYTLRFNFQLSDGQLTAMYLQSIFLVLISAAVFSLFGVPKGLVRHTGLKDAIRILKAICIIGVILIACNIAIAYTGVDFVLTIPVAVIIIFLLVTPLLMLMVRFSIRLFYYWLKTSDKHINVLIYGAGSAGLITKSVIQSDFAGSTRIVGFIDDNPSLIGKKLEGTYVYSGDVLNRQFLDENNISEIILAINNIDPDAKRKIVGNLTKNLKVQVKEVPPVDSWINGELSLRQINNVSSEESIIEEALRITDLPICKELQNKRIMITGAAGNTGKEIAKQLCIFSSISFILVDKAETPMYNLEMELNKRAELFRSHNIMSNSTIEYVMSDISSHHMAERLFGQYKPDIVIHLATCSKLHLLERNPYEAVKVNVTGTKILANLALANNVQRFIFIPYKRTGNDIVSNTIKAAVKYINSLSANKPDNSNTSFSIIYRDQNMPVDLCKLFDAPQLSGEKPDNSKFELLKKRYSMLEGVLNREIIIGNLNSILGDVTEENSANSLKSLNV